MLGRQPLSERFTRGRFWLVLGLTLLAAPPAGASDLRRTPIVKAIEKVRSSVVNIHGEKELTREEAALASLENERHVNGMGTGVVIDARGYIITNHHVVQGVKRIHVNFSDGAAYIARIVSRDPRTDLAVIKVDAPAPLEVICWGTSSDLMTGEPVIAVGNAFGYQHTVTRGIISALHRTVEVGEGQQYEDLIQTDASINPGNSGGPLLNIDGDLIGINVAVRAGAQGIGFAIPVDKVQIVAADLLSVRRLENRWHGIGSAREGEGNEAALKITSLAGECPAKKSGLQIGDVIVRAAGQPVARPLDLECALLGRTDTQSFDLLVRRDGRELTVPLRLAEAPADPQVADDSAWEVLGLRLASMTARRFREMTEQYRGGLLVTAVRPDSPAAEQGIRRGDVLVGMHIWETVSLENVKYILNREDLADLQPVKFYILRDQHTLFGHLQLTSTRMR